MRITVLGSAAGGGVPQWNCGCGNCSLVRAGSPFIRARTQDSICVFPAGDRAFVVNASPDILRQIEATPGLHPRSARHSPIAGILLTNGDMDHILGLFSLRESYPLTLWATTRVWEGLQRNAMMKTLDRFPGHVTFAPLPLGEAISLTETLTVTALPLTGKLPVHLMGALPDSPEDNVALAFAEDGRRAIYASACADTRELQGHAADVLLVDGTFYTEDELVRLGLGKAGARSMAHEPMTGEPGSLDRIATWSIPRRIYTHINNTNPVLVEGSAEASRVLGAGLEIAYDGMVIDV